MITLPSFCSASLCSMMCTNTASSLAVWVRRALAWLARLGSPRAHQDWPVWALRCRWERALARKRELVSSSSS